MHLFTPIATDLDLAVAAIAFFAVGLVLGYIVIPLYDSIIGRA